MVRVYPVYSVCPVIARSGATKQSPAKTLYLNLPLPSEGEPFDTLRAVSMPNGTEVRGNDPRTFSTLTPTLSG